MTRDFYLAYLNSPTWRMRRNEKIRACGWRCERCGGKRDLQVHHRSYERLGAETDSDLEVLCIGCHEAHHIAEKAASPDGIYLKLARQALSDNPFATIGDLAEDTKQLCADYHVPYNGPEIHRVLGLITGTRIAPAPRQTAPQAATGRPLTAAEAHELWCRLFTDVATIKTFGQGPSPQALRAHELKVREQAQRYRYKGPRRRRPLRDRLQEIFSERSHDE